MRISAGSEGVAGGDTIDDGAGNDILQGRVGTDSLVGGLGDDILVGGLDDDTLTGGPGADTFKVGEGHDHVDYVSGVDVKVDISHVLNTAEGDHTRLGFMDDEGKAKLVIYDDAAHTNEIGSVTFDNINSAGLDLNSLLNQIDLDHTN